MSPMSFTAHATTRAEEDLRTEVRTFVSEEMSRMGIDPGLGIGAVHCPEFSKRLAARGWVGMSIPTRHGGHGRTAVERFIVIEELLAAGAPVAAHWIADRQTAPSILAFGTDDQRERFLPGIAAGESYWSLGMSEPDAGSDLAAVRTAARQVGGGWSLSGTKMWTTNAHRNHYVVVLCRTSSESDRHAGLSQLIVDLTSPGVEVSAITSLNGGHHFNAVTFTDVFVPDDLVLGTVGDGWRQVTTELAHERATPDRYMSTSALLTSFLDHLYTHPDAQPAAWTAIATLTARLWTLRHMSLNLARTLDSAGASAEHAALVKDLGTAFEQESIDVMRTFVSGPLISGSTVLFERMLANAVLVSPTFTLRGGTSEVLRTMIARRL